MLISVARITILLLLPFTILAAPSDELDALRLSEANDDQKLSYLLGMDLYEQRTKQGFILDPEMVAQAIRDEQTGTRPDISSTEYKRIVELKREKIASFEKRWQALSEKNLADGKVFMKQKAQEPGVIKTDSGFMYKVLKPGTGKIPNLQDIAKIHYRGTSLNGKEFDSSYKRGKPAEFPVAKVKLALKETLQLMREGAKWEFYSPPQLGYGEEGSGPIGPNETLIMKVELIEILK